MSKSKANLVVNVNEAKAMLAQCIRAGLVPILEGSPGVGKSAGVHQVAAEFNLEVIDLRLSQCDPTDLKGFPQVREVLDPASGSRVMTGKGQALHPLREATYVPMDTFPLIDTPLPPGKDGWILFLDEFSSAPLSVQAAAYKIVLDKAIEQHKLHPKCAIVCAGNLATDNAIVTRQSTAMQSRLVHIFVDVDFKSWADWAVKSKVDHRVLAYLRFKPSELYQFTPDHDDATFRCPRTWEFMSNLLNSGLAPDHSNIKLMSGTIGEAGARQFAAFCKIYDDMVTIDEILANPSGTKIPEEKSTQFALTGSIANHANPQNLDSLMTYVDRLPREFQVLTVQDMLARNDALLTLPVISNWLVKNGQELFAV